MINDRSGKLVGKYYGPPASWEAMDSSKVVATQVAVAPASVGSPASKGAREIVKYQTDYIFWKAA
ncbi:hypothetical protein IWX85_000450 [Polaromonas sp. CG_9.11]|nr:hypothetical protein [Polaromonas sp. CG_9.11]